MARVIKASGRVVPSAVYDAKVEAEEIVARARVGATALASAALLEAADVRAKAEREGRDAGRAQAAALLIDARLRHDQSLAESERELLRLSVALAERILRAQLELDPGRVRDIAAGVLDHARRAQRKRLHVNPADAPLLSDLLASAGPTELVEDATIERGGCVLESDLGTLDGRIEVQVAELRRAVLGDDS